MSTIFQFILIHGVLCIYMYMYTEPQVGKYSYELSWFICSTSNIGLTWALIWTNLFSKQDQMCGVWITCTECMHVYMYRYVRFVCVYFVCVILCWPVLMCFQNKFCITFSILFELFILLWTKLFYSPAPCFIGLLIIIFYSSACTLNYGAL